MSDSTRACLSGEELAEIKHFVRSLNEQYWINIDKDKLLKDTLKLLSHIEALSTRTSGMTEERAREILAQAFEAEGDAWEDDGATKKMIAANIRAKLSASITPAVAIAAITQALTESPGQGTDGACRDLIEQCAEIIRWRETGLLQQGGYLHARAEKLKDVPERLRVRVAEDDVCIEAMRFVSRALPLPVSADGSAK